MNKATISRYLSYILRHHPEDIQIELESHGWADVEKLLLGMSKKCPLTMEILEDIVYTDQKGRYAFNEDKTKIRARQGHSILVDVDLLKANPPIYLYHGTATRFKQSIDKEGLKLMTRLYLHLSYDEKTTYLVGKRHGKPLGCRVQSQKMTEDGYTFFLSENGVWLTEKVPIKHLESLEWQNPSSMQSSGK